jgi:chromosome segregation protein
MHLTHVHMENFKSFGRKLTVDFEPGFTGITGPNGSGKSNIGDAILFVLGPNSSRAIRAGRLTDLIFNGGSAGKAASYCLVSLEFDNRDRTMPIDSDMVTLTRKVKKTPKKDDPTAYKSYYYLNERSAKKREFVDLLNHARISADGYNITQQGDVLQICQMSNVERRKVLDNIAGVTTFDNDIGTADKRKAEVEENLERIGIVLEEIERNLKTLEKEKDAAQKFKDLQSARGETRALMAWRRKSDLEVQIAQVQGHIAKYTEERAKLDEQLATQKEAFATAQTEFTRLEQQIRAEGGEEVEKIQNQVKDARDKMVRLEEKIHFVKEELHGGDEDLMPVREELRRITKELERTRKTATTLGSEYEVKSSALVKVKADTEALRDRMSQQDKGAMAINRELGQLKQEYEAKQLEKQDALLNADRLQHKLNETERSIRGNETELKTVETNLEEASWEIAELKKTTGGSDGEKKGLEKRLFEMRKAQAEFTQQNEDLENKIRRLSREQAELQAQMDAAARTGGATTRAVDELMRARDNGQLKGVIGTISELASVDDEYQYALQIAAAANMNAVLVEDDAVAQQCIEFLKSSRAGRAKLLPLNKMVPGRPRGQALMKVKQEGSLGFALDLVDFNPRYQNAFWHAFGDTLVAQNLAAGRRLMGGIRMVTLDGELFEAGGAMVGGAKQKAKASGFSNNDRGGLDKIMSDIAAAEQAQEQVIDGMTRVRQELNEIQDKLDDYNRGGQTGADRLKEWKQKAEILNGKHAAFTTELEKLRQAAKVQEEAHQEEANRAEAAVSRIAELEALREEKGQLLLKGSKKEWRDQLEAWDKETRELQEQVLSAESRQQTANKQAELISARAKELDEQITGSAGKRIQFEKDLEEFQAKHKKASAEVDALMAMERKATTAVRGLQDKKDKQYKDLIDVKNKMEKIGDRMETHYGLIVNAKSKLPGLEENLGEALIELREHPIEVTEEMNVASLQDLKQKLRGIEASIDRLGAVNMRALEEFESQSTRKTSLNDEIERLTTQRRELDELVAEISMRKKDVFMKVYNAINENFTEVYAGLSMGGRALMELEDSEDPFAGGLILKAQPMGKRVTRLDALSGGEKSLTSMAFIFSLQRYDPSPFYYFDEVDQNLDAVNSELLARMIKENSKYAQFIVVSLRKITLKEAERIYGVTQQIPGQSEMIANFDLGNMREQKAVDEDDQGMVDEEPRPGETLDDAIKGMITVEVKE